MTTDTTNEKHRKDDVRQAGTLTWADPAPVGAQLVDAMIDIETLGTAPGSAILSIGAVMFGPAGLAEEFYAPISLASCTAAGLTIDPETVEWWMKQSEAARAAAFREGAEPLPRVLSRFSTWFDQVGAERPWSQGANFDPPLLEAAYRACGMTPPWKFRDVRDTRTLYEQADVKVDRARGTHHNALDDARAQAEAAVIALQRLQNARAHPAASTQPAPIGCGGTGRSSDTMPCLGCDACPRVSEQDERALFEAAWRAKFNMPDDAPFSVWNDGSYKAPAINDCYDGWRMARALAHSAQAAQGSGVQADDLAWHKEALAAVRGKLDAVWQGVRDAVEKYSGQPCEGEPFDRLDELLARLAAHPAPSAAPAHDDKVIGWIVKHKDGEPYVIDCPTEAARVKRLPNTYKVRDITKGMLYAGTAPAQVAQPSHETIVQEGASLVCTACGTAAQVAQTDEGAAEFLSKRLTRVARAVGHKMPEGDHEFIAGVAGTILGDIARKLEAAQVAQGEPVADYVRAGWFLYEGVEWVATSSDDPCATVLYRLAAPVAASQPQQAEAPHHFACERKGYNPLCAGCDAEQAAHQAGAQSEGDET